MCTLDLVVNPVRIIGIFAIHTAILPPCLAIVGAVIVVNIYTCVSRKGVFCYLQRNFCTEMRASNR